MTRCSRRFRLEALIQRRRRFGTGADFFMSRRGVAVPDNFASKRNPRPFRISGRRWIKASNRNLLSTVSFDVSMMVIVFEMRLRT